MGTPERITTVQQIGTYHNNPKGNNHNNIEILKLTLGGWLYKFNHCGDMPSVCSSTHYSFPMVLCSLSNLFLCEVL